MSAQQLVHARWTVGLVARAGEDHQGSNAAVPSGEEGKGFTAQEGEVYVYKLKWQLKVHFRFMWLENKAQKQTTVFLLATSTCNLIPHLLNPYVV